MGVVVIGGGIIGCSTAWQLARRGVRNIVLLEQNGLTQGKCWTQSEDKTNLDNLCRERFTNTISDKAAGNIVSTKMSRPIAEMALYSRSLYASFPDVGFHETGGLAVARTQDSWRVLQQTSQVDRYVKGGSKLVSPQEVAQVHPLLQDDDSSILGGLYSPNKDGVVNPADLTMHIARLAKELGVDIKENTEVVDFDVNSSTSQVNSVRTNTGEEFHCDQVFIAGGSWTKQLVRRIVNRDVIPTAIVPHQYVVFEPIEGVSYDLPVLRDFDNKYYLKPDAGGSLVVGIFEDNPTPHLPPAVVQRNIAGVVPSTANNELFEDSFEKMGSWIDRVLESVPALNTVGIKGWIHGPDAHSADHSPIMGKVPGTKNVFVATGFNSQGIQCGAGAGLAMAEWMLDGHPHSFQTDFTSVDVVRFSPDLAKNATLVQSRACEGYGTLYSVHYPHHQFESQRHQKRLPAHDMHHKAGAVFGEAFMWERPLYYLTSEELELRTADGHDIVWASQNESQIRSPVKYSFEYRDTEWFEAERRESILCRENAVMFDLSPFGKFTATGPGVGEVLEKLCTNKVREQPDGALVYTLMCNGNGGVLADFTVGKVSEEEFYIVCLADQPHFIYDHINQYLKENNVSSEEMLLKETTEEGAVFGVMGPDSRAILEHCFKDSVHLDDDAFPMYTFQVNVPLRNGVKCSALRVSFAGTLGWELHFPSKDAAKVYELVHDTAKSLGYDSFQDAGVFSLMNSLRLEKKFIHYGHEVSPLETPLDIGMGYCCKLGLDDPDFIGKKAIIEQRQEGRITKQLITVTLKNTGDREVSFFGNGSELLYRNNEVVGYITSGGYSHVHDTPIGLSLCSKFKIKNQKDKYEAEVTTKDGVKRFPVVLSSKPLVGNSVTVANKAVPGSG